LRLIAGLRRRRVMRRAMASATALRMRLPMGGCCGLMDGRLMRRVMRGCRGRHCGVARVNHTRAGESSGLRRRADGRSTVIDRGLEIAVLRRGVLVLRLHARRADTVLLPR
jgi:hypothetical protein